MLDIREQTLLAGVVRASRPYENDSNAKNSHRIVIIAAVARPMDFYAFKILWTHFIFNISRHFLYTI